MGATSGTGTAHSSGAHEFTPIFSGVHVTRSLVLCVFFVDRSFSFGYWVVCPSSIYTDSDYPLGIFKHFFVVVSFNRKPINTVP
jgi:hypothetical protein